MPSESTLALLRERIFHFAASRLSREAAEDLAQETLLLLHEKYPQVSQLEELLPLAFQIVRFKLTAAVRKSVRRGETTAISTDDLQISALADSPERLAARSELRSRLLGAITKLGDRCRELLRLKLEGRTFDDIRRHFGVDSINTIYTWDSRCRHSLLERLGGRWERLP